MRNIGPTELMLVLGVIMLLFGAKKLPELARGSGRALRIFKAETKGLTDEDDASDVLTADPVVRRSRSVGRELPDDVT
jgi:sec-independent protein translocase protein TatA